MSKEYKCEDCDAVHSEDSEGCPCHSCRRGIVREVEQVKPKAKGWTLDELNMAVIAYKDMLRFDAEGIKYVKSHIYKELAICSDRSAKSFEFRMQNISHVYTLLGMDYVKGLKPAKNVGAKIIADITILIKGEFFLSSCNDCWQNQVRTDKSAYTCSNCGGKVQP